MACLFVLLRGSTVPTTIIAAITVIDNLSLLISLWLDSIVEFWCVNIFYLGLSIAVQFVSFYYLSSCW